MLNKITLQITNYIKLNGNIKDQRDLDRINYSLQVILGDLLKIIILICMFLSLSRIKYFLFSLLILSSMRTFLGGYHCKTFTTCFCFSLVFFLITSFVGPMIPKLSNNIYYIISLINILIVVLYAPFPNIKRPIKTKKRRQNLKLLSIFSLIFWTSLLCFKVKNTSYINCGFLSLMLQTYQKILFVKGDIQHEKTL
ncbi:MULTISPECIES: accessory gene regulator ArgB-like protein [Clostridium]|uniref:ArgB n=1 Tax=Clostridium novyi B str. ATCC 27606 TaxID=1443123 RepID=A0AA40IRN7_CLONO|nr:MULTISPECIES: accessory gene regulator B family protein [Clostridium]KEI07991.1 putative accessory gene regulator B [Clostridium novyi B str. NCTC 9691]KEI11381.1 putative argB [Clostridium novyi B str. ATCC 27606]OOB76499.1 accessory regulator AgrB [Clostridium haemolyticum]